jgi:hypothetical protein
MARLTETKMTKEEEINQLIAVGKAAGNVDTNLISDGYHTFGELYAHRVGLFIALCRKVVYIEKRTGDKKPSSVWRSRRHADGESQDGWFVLGIGYKPGEQISYHLSADIWDETGFAVTLDAAPEFDGHTSDDVLKRLANV